MSDKTQPQGGKNKADGMPTIELPMPAYEPITLPSLGRLYTPPIEEGIIHIRPMTLREEEVLTTPSLIKSGEAIDEIFRRCIREKINVDDLLAADKTAILLFLRAASYGREYEIKVDCTECEAEVEHLMDLEADLQVKYIEDNFAEPIVVELPKAGTTAYVRLPRSRDDKILSKRKAKRGKVDTTLSQRLSLLVERIEGVDEALKSMFLEQLTAYDASLLKEAVSEDYFGIETTLQLTCDTCGEDFEAEFPINENFFRVYKATKKSR